MKRSLLPLIALATVTCLCGAAPDVRVPPSVELGRRLPLVFVAPLLALLASIAVLPGFAPAWWERNTNKAKVAAFFSVPLAVLLVFHFGRIGLTALSQRAEEYVSLMTFLAALYVVCGGIFIKGSFAGRPLSNTVILALGALLANVLGTLGATMILIRPLIRANEHRLRAAHVPIFLIFIVANCAGLLTPLGDPPLFLGFLAGVPFGWTLRLFPIWAFVNGILLGLFLLWDRSALAREQRELPPGQATPFAERPSLQVQGLSNVVFLLGILAAVFAAGAGFGNSGNRWPFGILEGLIAVLAIASVVFTNRGLREQNRFTVRPIVEVAVLFAGIFITMTPALLILNAYADKLGLERPSQFFWASGLVSAVLDNTPTYLAFTAVACGAQGVPAQGRYLDDFLNLSGQTSFDGILAAISCGCVLMGALTYIGNGPNFLVKAIADESSIRMPGFGGYMLWAMSILIPLFGLVTILFFLV